MIRLILFCFLMVSCVHNAIQPLANRGDLLFPYGTYRHNVDLVVLTGEETTSKKFNFVGVIQSSTEQIKMTALSPLGMSIFKVVENLRTEQVDVQIFMSSLEKYKNQFSDYYKLIRVLFSASLNKDSESFKVLKRNAETYPEITEVTFRNQKNEFTLVSHQKSQ